MILKIQEFPWGAPEDNFTDPVPDRDDDDQGEIDTEVDEEVEEEIPPHRQTRGSLRHAKEEERRFRSEAEDHRDPPRTRRRLHLHTLSSTPEDSKALTPQDILHIYHMENYAKSAPRTFLQEVAEKEMSDAGVGGWARDDVTGEPLDPSAVARARAEEMEFIRRIHLYDEADIDECLQQTGKFSVSTKWVDIAKDGDVRSRLAARDFKPHGEKDRADLFAAMPPLEAKKLMFRLYACDQNLKRGS